MILRPDELEIAHGLPPHRCSLEAAQQYTRWLATHHYENFNVVSWLLPKNLRQDFYNIYAYCRWADDLGDEVPQATRALELLDWWGRELDACYAGTPGHPVFVALQQTISAKVIPKEPFADLLKAFRQDQTVKRYQTWESLLRYCSYSANPVGRLLLCLCGYQDNDLFRLSDATCTALQLANFWQDVSRDLEKGRIYIPEDALTVHGLNKSDILERRFDERYIRTMKDLIARTRGLFAEGMPLSRRLAGHLSVDVEMFSRGGLAILREIEAMGYDTLHKRPKVSKGQQAMLLGRVAIKHLIVGNQAQNPHGAKSTSAVTPARYEGQRDAGLRESYEECHRITRAARSNFYYAFLILPRPKRDALAALYAFMRLVDDVADDGADLPSKQRGLANWRYALDQATGGREQLFDGTAAMISPPQSLPGAAQILPALADAIQRYKIPSRYLHDLISGAEMDLTMRSYATFDDLRKYCYHVAGTVGLTCTHVFGFTDKKALDLAEKLGLAFQLTNIIRDVKEDYQQGRVYLPQDLLARFAVQPSDFSQAHVTKAMREVLRFLTNRAWQCYEEGSGLVSLVDVDSQSALRLLVSTYSALLAHIESLDFEVFARRVRLSKGQKMLFAAKARFGKHPALSPRNTKSCNAIGV